VRLADAGVGVHHDPGPRAVHARLPAARPVGVALLVVGDRRLAEVPDTAVAVLGVPVLGALEHAPAVARDVRDDRAAHAEDRLRAAASADDVDLAHAVLDARVDPARARPEGQIGVGDARDEGARGRQLTAGMGVVCAGARGGAPGDGDGSQARQGDGCEADARHGDLRKTG
jgi:hypothetical protein